MAKDKRPAMQFYIGDWKKDPNVRACSIGARGLWVEMILAMFECEPRGYMLVGSKQATVQQIAVMAGCSLEETQALLKELEEARVFSRTEDGTIYSRRMVRDEQLRAKRQECGKLGGNPRLVNHVVNQEVNHVVNQEVNHPLKVDLKHSVEDEDEDAVPSLSSGSNPLADFERWFNAYPKHRRDDYNGCLREWANNHCDTCPSEVIAGLDAWKASEEWRVEAGKFVPAARKFLTTRKWESRPNAPEAIQCDPKARRRNESDGEYAMRLLQEGVA